MKSTFSKIRLLTFFTMFLCSFSSYGQNEDTLYLNYQIPTVFEKMHTPGTKLIIWDKTLNDEVKIDSATTWLFPHALVAGITDCKYGIEFNYNTVEIVFLRAKNDAGVRNIRNFVIDLCPDFTLTENKKSNYTFCKYQDFQGVPCIICYTENRKKRTAFMEISHVEE